MLSETLSQGLKKYEIGQKLRTLRLKKKMGLVQLGKHTGLSPAMLSKIERGRLFPTLPTLLRIAMVFSVGLEHFFAGGRAADVVRAKERIRLPDDPTGRRIGYWFESLDFPAVDRKLNGYLAVFVAVDPTKAPRHQHSGAELVYVLKGRLLINIQEVAHELWAGDSIYFDSSAPHSYAKGSSADCTALVVTVP
jgi:transcriptional regulator with XRE-family HTH domain